MIANRIEGEPNPAIRRGYVSRIRNARRSIDITNAYFLPGPIFLHALRRAVRRGVRVRLLVPDHSDVFIMALAMNSLYGRLLADGVEVYAFTPRVLHSKTAVFDDRFTTIGSHNLHALSWRFNLECNVIVDSIEFGAVARDSFERDLREARRLDLAEWRARPWSLRAVAWLAALFRAFL